MKNNTKSMRGIKKLCIILAIILAVGIAFTVLAPPVEELSGRISAELIEKADDKYNETSYNFLVVTVSRGRNVKTAEQDTYLGVLGMVLNVNEGFGKTAADILFWLPALVSGAEITISLTVLSVMAGLFLSIFLALGKMSKMLLIRKFCDGYIFFFRGTPLLMQLFFVYYGLPQIDPSLAINNKFLAAFIAFALNSAAYCAEIIRAAIQSIDKEQFEVSRTLGFSYSQTMLLVVIPQSIRRLIPPVSNEFIMVLKDASLVAIIALADLTQATRSISSSTGSVLVFIPAMIIYLIITGFFTFLFNRLEKRFSIYN